MALRLSDILFFLVNDKCYINVSLYIYVYIYMLQFTKGAACERPIPTIPEAQKYFNSHSLSSLFSHMRDATESLNDIDWYFVDLLVDHDSPEPLITYQLSVQK